ncbi:ABC transporter permease [Thalassobacillus sp. CUG 92003]|uniref:ABC transporter permease n=1 Tax=Thalassobacillus sp. CUG 92003 TaxID=2736641 RepID=UPI00210685C6|nr:ABC transporter permease subunit [Thalassobacillus sp. CUG 92003]
MLIGSLVVLVNLIVGGMTGKALALYDFKGKSVLETLFLAPILIPIILLAMGAHLAMIRLDLAGTWVGIAIIHLIPTLPYSIRIMTNGYHQIGRLWLEQSEILGASPVKKLLTIELPLLKPAIRSLVFLVIVISLSQYAITAIIGGGEVLTLALVFFPFLDTADTSVLAAFSLWFALVPLIMYILAETFLSYLPYHGKRWRKHI